MAEPVTIDLSDRVALVTGGGAGIGRGVSVELARCGAAVVVADIDPQRAEKTMAMVEALGRQALPVTCDVMDADQLRSAVAMATERFGRLDILVNNAGGVRPTSFLSQSDRSRQRHIEINLSSVFTATAAAVPVMIDGGRGGSVVNVASIEASRAAPGYAVYAACKAAVVNFTRSMALELAEDGVRVNAISPDLTRTPGNLGMMGEQIPDELPEITPAEADRARRHVPLGRQGTIEECGRLVAFLCSSLASYITGINVPVDGGTWASSGWHRSTSGAWTLSGE